MKRKSIIFAILCVLMLVSGCSSQSTDDIYQMMENASSKSNGSESSGQSDMVSDNSPRVYTEDYKECNKNYMPELVQTGETAKVTIGSRNDTLSFTVTDALITDDFSDLRQLTSQAAYDNIRNFLLYVETDDYIDEQGNILDSERGVERKALFVKLSIKNENNSEYTLPIHSLSLYSIKKENSVMQYRRLKGTNDGGPICANAPDAFTLKSASKANDFLPISLPAAANWHTSPMLEALEACPPVLEYISVSNTITFTFSPEASTWSRPPKPIS